MIFVLPFHLSKKRPYRRWKDGDIEDGDIVWPETWNKRSSTVFGFVSFGCSACMLLCSTGKDVHVFRHVRS